MSLVKPLVLKTGDETQVNSSTDLLDAKGYAFDKLDSHFVERLGGVVKSTTPDSSYAYFYLANGEIDYYEVFEGSTQTVGFRRLKVSVVYNLNFEPTSEVWIFYDRADGITILRTITLNHTWTAGELVKTVEVTT